MNGIGTQNTALEAHLDPYFFHAHLAIAQALQEFADRIGLEKRSPERVVREYKVRECCIIMVTSGSELNCSDVPLQ
jgi:hypothetical protein